MPSPCHRLARRRPFDYATSAPGNASDRSGFGTEVISSDHTGGNVGGLKGDFHRVSLKLPAWQSPAPGATPPGEWGVWRDQGAC